MFNDLRKEFLRDLLADGRSPRTVTSYEAQLKSFEAFLEDKGLAVADVTPAHLREYLTGLWDAKRYATMTICLKVRAMKRFFEWLHRTGKLMSDPSQLIKEPKVEKRSPRQTLNPDSVRQMIETVNTNTPIGIRNVAILETLASCGLRHAELMALRSEDIDLKSGMLVVREGKGGKPRVVPLTSPACYWLKQYLDRARPALSRSQEVKAGRKPSDGLWLGEHGQPLRREMLRLIIKQYAVKAGLGRGIQVHDFRRFVLTEVVKNGMPLPLAAELAGHSDCETLRTYCATSGLDLKQVLKAHPREHDAKKDIDDDDEPITPSRMR
jgi:integrase/recombinase XerD